MALLLLLERLSKLVDRVLIGVVGILESFVLLNNLGLQSLGRLLRLVEINPGAGE